MLRIAVCLFSSYTTELFDYCNLVEQNYDLHNINVIHVAGNMLPIAT